MKFSQYTHFIKTKQFAKFREVTDKNDGVMTSSKLRLDVKKWWRHISVKNDGIVSKLCRRYYYVRAITFVKFHQFSFIHSWVIKIRLFSKRQILMTSSTTLTDKIRIICFWKLLGAKVNTLILLRTKFHYFTMCRNTILSHIKSSGATPPHWPVSLGQNVDP